MAKTTKIDLSKATLGAASTVTVSVDSAPKEYNLAATDTSLVLSGIGTLTSVGNSLASFTADASFSGELNVTESAGASVESFDFSKAQGVTYTADANDTLVTFSAGADQISLDAATVTGRGYNYGQGDVLLSSQTAYAKALSSAGDFTVGSATVKVDPSTSNGLYQIKTKNGNDTLQFWTGIGQADAVADASGVADSLMADFTDSKTAKVTLGSGAASVNAAQTATTVLSGSGKDTINNDQGALTLSIGTADGEDSLAKALQTSDTLIFESGRFSRVSIGSTDVTYGKTTVKNAAAAEGKFGVQFGTDSGVLQYGSDITAATDATYFYGTADDSSIRFGADYGTSINVDLSESGKYRNFNYIATSLGGAIKGANTDAKETVDASAATAALSVELGAGDDVISLNGANDVRDTIVVALDSGKDKVTGFKGGFGTDADVLKVSGLTSLKDVAFSSASSVVSVGADASIDLDAAGDQILVQLDDGTLKKVAYQSTGGNTIKGATDVDVVFGAANGNSVYKLDSVASAADTSFILDLSDTKKFQNITKADLSETKGKVTVMSGTTGDHVTLGSGAADVWMGRGDDAATLKGGHAASTIWYGTNEGSTSVTGFTNSDTVYFYDLENVTDVTGKYNASVSANGVVFTDKRDSRNTLTLAGTNKATFAIKTNGGLDESGNYKFDTSNVLVTSTSTAEFASDTAIYYTGANATVSVSADYDDTDTMYSVDMRDVTKAEGKLGSYSFGDDVTNFDASASASRFLLVGNGTSTLRGGDTVNIFWGGDSSSQTFYGKVGAQDNYWFGQGDGADTVAEGVDKEDIVYLWSETSIADVKVNIKGADAVISIGDNDALTLKNGRAAINAGLTFETQNEAAAYTYDTATNAFVSKSKKA